MIFKLAFQKLLAVLYWTKLGNVLNKYILHAKMFKLSGKRLMFQSIFFLNVNYLRICKYGLRAFLDTSDFAFFTFLVFFKFCGQSACTVYFTKHLQNSAYTHIQTIYICEGGFAWCGPRLKSDVGRFCINVPLGTEKVKLDGQKNPKVLWLLKKVSSQKCLFWNLTGLYFLNIVF